MEKIVIIGSSGAGKSTFASALGSLLNIKALHLDRHLWQYDWKGRTEHARKKILENLTVSRKKQWIIEGNYLRFSEIHVDAADTIIFWISHLWYVAGICSSAIMNIIGVLVMIFRRGVPID